MKALLALVLLTTPAMAQEAQVCVPYSDYLAKLAKDFGEQPVARSLAMGGQMMTITATANGDTYTILATKPDAGLTTCMAGQGRDWQAVTPPAAGDPA